VNKYHARRTYRNGYVFASLAEAERYSELQLMEKAEAIHHLTVHPVYILTVNGVHIGNYIGDFEYWESGKQIVEDVKGFSTPVYKLKKKLMAAIHGIEITEVPA